MLRFTVRKDRCKGCGTCLSDCPMGILELGSDHIPQVAAGKESSCIECQHCLAVCPTAAISVLGLDPDASPPVARQLWPSYEQMAQLVRGRRSVRQYADRNVDPQLIDALLAATANAPTGANRRALSFRVIDDRAQMQPFREQVMGGLVRAHQAGTLPRSYAFLGEVIRGYLEQQLDAVFRGAPHVLVVSASRQALCATEDVPLALAYFELLAQSAGLGTVWCGFLKIAFEAVPSLKALVGLPADHHYYAMLFGYPAIHYARTVQREDAAVIQRVRIV